MELKNISILLDGIDTDLLKENPEYDAYKTDFGKEFENNYFDLISFTNITSMFPFLLQNIVQAKNTINPEEIFDFLDRKLEEAKNALTNEEHNQKKKIEKSRGLLKELRPIFLDPNYFSDIPLLSEPSSEEKNSEKSEENTIDTSFIEELRLMERIYSYFVLTLYSYIDIYSMALFQYIISEVPTDEVFDLIKSVKIGLNPTERIKSLMKNLTFDDDSNLKKIAEKLLKEKSWENYQDEFNDFIKIRNYIAHRDPITAKKVLAEKFPNSAKKARNSADELKKNINLEEIKDEFILAIIKPFLDYDFESFFLIRFIGESCYKYLALIDILAFNFFYSEIIVEMDRSENKIKEENENVG